MAETMRKSSGIVLFIVIAVTAVLTSVPCLAVSHWPAQRPYRYEVAGSTVHKGKNVLIAFHIVRNDTNEIVKDAVLSAPKLALDDADAVDGPGKVIALNADSKGNYFLAADLPATGAETLEFLAKMPGEEQPLHGLIAFTVEP